MFWHGTNERGQQRPSKSAITCFRPSKKPSVKMSNCFPEHCILTLQSLACPTTSPLERGKNWGLVRLQVCPLSDVADREDEELLATEPA